MRNGVSLHLTNSRKERRQQNPEMRYLLRPEFTVNMWIPRMGAARRRVSPNWPVEETEVKEDMGFEMADNQVVGTHLNRKSVLKIRMAPRSFLTQIIWENIVGQLQCRGRLRQLR